MDILHLPAFADSDFLDEQISDASRSVLIPKAKNKTFSDCCRLLEQKGFVEKEQLYTENRCYAGFSLEKIGVFVQYFSRTEQLQLVIEKNCNYFSYIDLPQPICTTPRLTQLYLSDYGMSYVVRLSDGRLIIIDGANAYEKDVDNLYARLKEESPFPKPVIAAWIFTHPHSDHYFCFFPFMDKYADAVEIQKFLFNFPQADDFTHYPKLQTPSAAFSLYSGDPEITCSQILQRFRQRVALTGIPVYTPHTGQTYHIGDAAFHFFSSLDNTIHYSDNINATSLMFTMDLAGQRIFFSADGSFSDALLAERYGSELRSDILQVPHHGFGCGTDEAQIQGFRLIAPKICLLPVEKDLAYRSFTTYREGTNYLMTRLGIKELLTGEKEHTLELPYKPDPTGVYRLQQNYHRGRDDAGTRTWVFTQLHSANPEDFCFSFLNTTYLPATVTAELYFENMEKNIRRFTLTVPKLGVYKLHCLKSMQEDSLASDFSELLKDLGIPEDTGFAVRFLSDLPIVVSHKNRTPTYQSSVI